jgi:hypothetical protein
MAIVASFLSMLLVSQDITIRYQRLEFGLFLVDLVLLAGFVVLSLFADRFWPLWITGIHLVGVATHTAKTLDPNVVPQVYSWIQGLWAYPIIALIVIGTARHQKRLKRFGADNSWNAFFGARGRKMLQSGPSA